MQKRQSDSRAASILTWWQVWKAISAALQTTISFNKWQISYVKVSRYEAITIVIIYII